MKTCIKCNLSYDDDKKFCKKCGDPLTSEYQIEPKAVAKKTVYEDRLKIDPLNIELLHEYAQFLFNNLLFKEAITVSLKILAINDNDLESNELLFKSYSKLNMFNEASTFGKQLLVEKPTDIFLIEELARISRELGNSELATEYYDKIIRLSPSNAYASYNKALILLEKNQLELAIEIFRKIYLGGQNDRITTIYAGIDKALNADFKAAIYLLSPILENENLDQTDLHYNRGVLYLLYSLSQSSAGLSEIKQGAARVNLKNLKQNYHRFDEIAFVKITEYIICLRLNKINSSPDAKNQIIELARSYIREDYFTSISNSNIAEMWYAIGNKQVELELFPDPLNSFQKAIDLYPNENKYNEKYADIKKLIEDNLQKKKRKRKRKTKILILSFIVGFIIVAVAIFAYKSFHIYTLFNENSQFTLIKGGTFQMGSFNGEINEKPVHTVIISDFYMGKYEVTQNQWKSIMQNNPSQNKGDNLPVENVSWNDVQVFLSKLNTKTNKTFRLPTEAEWEYAARGGNNSKGFLFSGSNTLKDVAGDGTTHPVGRKQPNELGLYDMSGNLWEWCNDRFAQYSSFAQTNPKGPSLGVNRIYRGGSWSNIDKFCRSTARDYYRPGYRSGSLGFRLVYFK